MSLYLCVPLSVCPSVCVSLCVCVPLVSLQLACVSGQYWTLLYCTILITPRPTDQQLEKYGGRTLSTLLVSDICYQPPLYTFAYSHVGFCDSVHRVNNRDGWQAGWSGLGSQLKMLTDSQLDTHNFI